MAWSSYRSEEKYGFIWAVLTADAHIDVDGHLGPLTSDLESLQYETYGYHTEQQFESEVSWKGALEAFAEGYHFQYVHPTTIAAGAIGNATIHDAFGKHHRLGFPLMWITDLVDNPRWKLGYTGQSRPDLLDLPKPSAREQSCGSGGNRYPSRRIPHPMHRQAQLDGAHSGH